jgi:hypothetical protein
MYNYLEHRESLVNLCIGFQSEKTGQINWDKAFVECNIFFNEQLSKNVWRVRFQRAQIYLQRISLKLPQQLKQRNTENHLRQLGTLDNARKTVLIEEALKTLENQSEKVKFDKEMFNFAQDDEFVFVTSDFHFDGDEDMLKAIQDTHKHIITQQSKHNFKRIKLMELGDIVEGSHLRPSQLLAIKTMLIPQTIRIAQAYVDMLNELSKDMFVDFYCVTSSNHTQTRAFGSGRNELVEDDAMLIFAEVVKHATINNKNIKFTLGRDFVADVTPKQKMFVAHGHLVSGKKSGYIQELAMARGITFDYALFGHFHHYREITLYARDDYNMKVFYAPSMNNKQSDYELDRNLTSKAAILMMVFNEKRGHRYCEELFL